MTAISDDTDLSWVTFTDETSSIGCVWGDCGKEALYVARFRIIEVCTHPVQYYCMHHKDVIMERASQASGFFSHHGVCPGSLCRLESISPLRRAA